MNSTEKYIGETYRITHIAESSLWRPKQSELIGYRGTLIREGLDHFYTLRMRDGPHTNQTISIYGARLKQAGGKNVCRCAAYTFPHRASSGTCPTNSTVLNEHLEGRD